MSNKAPGRVRFIDRPHAKLLLGVVGAELLLIAGLLIWVVADSPTKTAVVIKPAPQTTTTNNEPKVELKKLVEGLQLPTAIASTQTVADKRLFVAEQAGTIRVINAAGKLDTTPYLDIVAKVQVGGEMGLLGLAFHPKLVENPYFYINYIDKQRNTIVARYTISKDTGRADPASEKVLLKIPQPYTNHNGGQLAFGPDGFLYIGMGDGGSGGDPENRAQNKNDLLGKMLRIDVDKGDPYAVPSGNPFAATTGVKPEIWSLGLRNPWRFSFDRKLGNLFIADVGQGDYEEISFQAKTSKGGENYGWRCFEGTHMFKSVECPEDHYVQPIVEYDHSEDRCSVTGGYVYRGKQFPALDGLYFFGDYCGGQIYTTKANGSQWITQQVAKTERGLSTFGEDSSGELYAANVDTGILYQIVDSAN